MTVTDVLAAEARGQFEQRGFTVGPATVVEAVVGDRTPSSLEEATALTTQGKIEGNVATRVSIRTSCARTVGKCLAFPT